MLTLDDWITSSGKYPERADSEELTIKVKDNAQLLLDSVNDLLVALSIDLSKVSISSGFRPSNVNSKIPNAAKKSLHMTGLALDLSDPDGSIDRAIEANPELLVTYGLWLESPKSTPKWCHLDKGTRSSRKVKIFNP